MNPAVKKDSVVEISIPARPEYLRIVRLLVSGFASRYPLAVDEVENLKVAVSEACNNAIQHAYDDLPGGRIKIKCGEQGGQLVFEVTDSGMGMSRGGDDTELEERGLGFLLIQTLVDEVDIRSNPDKGTKIVMRKKISAA